MLANGDARSAYNTLEALVLGTEPGTDGRRIVSEARLEDVLQKKLLPYDKSGEEHYNLISALHKSVRNSDPDAALYWLARMLESGEDPLYLARRMVRMASEDIGLAEPGALAVTLAAKEAFDFLGPPEGNLALAQAAVYLSLAPKSNALYTGYGDVQEDLQKTIAEPVPLHLRNAPTGLMSHLGYGKGYQYAHDAEEKVTDMACLPESLAGRRYYKPTDQGFEARIRQRLEEIRRIQKKAPEGNETVNLENRTQQPLRCLFAALSFALLVARAGRVCRKRSRIMEIDRDCEKFAISVNNRIVCAVPHLKRIKKAIIQRADVWVATQGKDKLIVEGEKFMPVPPPQSYMVDSLAWSPDGSRIVMNMTTQKPSTDEEPASGGKAIALLDEEGHEIKVEGSKTRFIEEAANGAWLADNVTVAYLIGAGPYKIGRVSVVSGQSSTLFDGHTFDAIVWDAPRNQAFALSQNLSVSGRQALFQLDLVHEGIREVTRIDTYQTGLNLSPSGKKIAFFADGDAVEVLDLASPAKPLRVRVGMGAFGWSRDETASC